jgi:S-layer homology domain
MPTSTRLAGFAFSLISTAAPGAQTAQPAPAWGTTDTTLYTVGPCDARNREMSHPAIPQDCIVLLPVPGSGYGAAGIPVHLPTGALMTEVIVNYYDTATVEPIIELLEVSPTGLVVSLALVNFPVFSGGDNTTTQPVGDHLVDNTNSYSLLVRLNTESESSYNALYSASIRYRLQVSPPPATATFNDVPTGHPFFQFIEALAASGITGGCGGGNYCPDNPVTRGQMAVFIAKALGLHFPN